MQNLIKVKHLKYLLNGFLKMILNGLLRFMKSGYGMNIQIGGGQIAVSILSLDTKTVKHGQYRQNAIPLITR